jgi:biotin carboxyl carrier protein
LTEVGRGQNAAAAKRLLHLFWKAEMAEFEVRSEIAGIVRKVEVAPGGTVAPDG